jgi:hypothetical protein
MSKMGACEVWLRSDVEPPMINRQTFTVRLLMSLLS